MTDFALYDVLNTCRICGSEYPGKAFTPQGAEPRFGLCPTHLEEDERRMARLKQPPKNHGKTEQERREVPDRRTLDFRRRAAGERD